MRKAPIVIILSMAVLAFSAMRIHRGENGMLMEHTGDAAPAINAPVLDGLDTFKTADWQGRAYAVNFFGSWCPSCRAEHDTLRMLADKHVFIIGVATNDNEGALRDFLVRDGNPYAAVALDPGGHVSHDWGVTGLPETFIVDKTGIIRFHYSGPLSASAAERDFLPVWNKLTP